MSLFSQVYLCVPDLSCFYWNTASINESIPTRKPHPKKMGAPEFWCPGTRTLVPFKIHRQVFCFNLKNVHEEYQFLFFPKCIYVFLTFPGFIGTLPT